MEAACLATASVNVKTATSHVAEIGSSSRDGSVIMDENNACSKQRVSGLSGVAKVEPLASPALSGPEEYDDDDDDDEDDDDEEDDRDSFDEVSSLQDQFEELDESIFDNDPEACTRQEAQALRLDLRAIGPEAFCAKYLDTEGMTAKKLLTAFGVRPPHVMDGSPDDAYYMLLGAAISRELSKRMKLPQYNTIDDAVALIKQSKNIVVLTGAGISTSLGIPDFRSKDIGLYSKLEHLGLNDPQEVFDIEQFRRDPTIFFSVAKDILPDIDRFTPTHAFIALLQKKGKLLTNYSQNIDNIEAVAGILPEKLIQCHGSFATATCQNCGYKASGETIFRDIKEEVIPRCPMCIKELQRLRAPGMKRKRSYNSQSKKKFQGGQKKYSDSDDESDYDVPEAGIMKPDITFFGEALPDRFGDRLTGHDKERVDLVIVIGTSLKVAPVSEVVPYLPANIPQMYISRTPVAHVNFDIDMLGDCDVVVEELCRRAGWDLNHEMTVPRDTQIEINLVEGYTSRYNFITPPAPDVKLR